eukprot:GHVN01015039.1.p1 GENE.GHVN01015039.1~~GHVN01015039.1.p1  ORF type:complete len:526 (-),score=131.67 GHVN01015039.1:844-2421(-)
MEVTDESGTEVYHTPRSCFCFVEGSELTGLIDEGSFPDYYSAAASAIDESEVGCVDISMGDVNGVEGDRLKSAIDWRDTAEENSGESVKPQHRSKPDRDLDAAVDVKLDGDVRRESEERLEKGAVDIADRSVHVAEDRSSDVSDPADEAEDEDQAGKVNGTTGEKGDGETESCVFDEGRTPQEDARLGDVHGAVVGTTDAADSEVEGAVTDSEAAFTRVTDAISADTRLIDVTDETEESKEAPVTGERKLDPPVDATLEPDGVGEIAEHDEGQPPQDAAEVDDPNRVVDVSDVTEGGVARHIPDTDDKSLVKPVSDVSNERVIDVTDVIEEKEVKCVAAEQFKEKGNKMFKEGKLNEAIDAYSDGLRVCDPEEPGDKIRAILFANRAAVLLAEGSHDDAIADCTEAIYYDPDYIKAYLRRFQSYEAQKKWHEALSDVNKAIELDPSLIGRYGAKQRKIETLSKEQFEKEKDEMVGKLKEFGNWALGKVGLNLDNFQVEQNEGGSYNIQFKPGGQPGPEQAESGSG